MDSPVHVATTCTGSAKGSDYFGSFVRSLSHWAKICYHPLSSIGFIGPLMGQDLPRNCNISLHSQPSLIHHHCLYLLKGTDVEPRTHVRGTNVLPPTRPRESTYDNTISLSITALLEEPVGIQSPKLRIPNRKWKTINGKRTRDKKNANLVHFSRPDRGARGVYL
jgi:hypothetical protein